jgi:hypothetical protein
LGCRFDLTSAVLRLKPGVFVGGAHTDTVVVVNCVIVAVAVTACTVVMVLMVVNVLSLVVVKTVVWVDQRVVLSVTVTGKEVVSVTKDTTVLV